MKRDPRDIVFLGWLALCLLGAAAAAAPSARAEEAAADYFVPDERLALRTKNLLDGELFRLEFTGPTAALRGLLSRLAASPLAFVVRSVEAEPLAEPASPAAPAPLAGQNLSRFVVVVEFVESSAARAAARP